MTGKRLAGWGDEQELASPATHTGLGEASVIIGDDIFDFDLAAQALLRGFYFCDGAIELVTRGEKAFAVGGSPSVILDVGEFNAGGAGGFGDGEHGLDLVDIAVVNDEI